MSHSSVEIDFEIRKFEQCDGTNDHYYWVVRGHNGSEFISDCRNTELEAADDASETIRYWVLDSATT